MEMSSRLGQTLLRNLAQLSLCLSGDCGQMTRIRSGLLCRGLRLRLHDPECRLRVFGSENLLSDSGRIFERGLHSGSIQLSQFRDRMHGLLGDG